MSCVKRPDRAPTILYAAEDFYSADLEQVWLRDGECISYMNTSLKCPYEENQNTSDINWNYRNNTDGSYSLTSYLHLSSQTPQNMIYICWVNHSTLSQPITANISSTECTEREQASIGICLLGFLDYTGLVQTLYLNIILFNFIVMFVYSTCWNQLHFVYWHRTNHHRLLPMSQ